MTDEITKPIEAVAVEGVGAEPVGEVEVPVVEPVSEPISEPVVEVLIPEVEKVTEPVVITEPEVIIPTESTPIPNLEPNTTKQEATPSQTANTTKQTATPEPTPAGVEAGGAEPTGEVQSPNTTKQEAFSSNPKLNAAALAFISYMGRTKETLALANKARKAQMMKRVYRVMDLFKKKKKIKNDDVEKFIHTDDSTATKYLNILTKENKIKRVGKPHGAYYTKVE